MDKTQQYIKLPKEFVQKNMTTRNKKGLVVAYLYFHTTIDQEVYTTIDCICSELQMSTKSHGERRSQNIIHNILSELITEQVINFIPTNDCSNFQTVSNNQLFKIKINYESFMFNSTSKYVRVEKSEYDKLVHIKSTQLHKIFNIFYQIKSYVCMDDNCLHICYPSIKTLCNCCSCSDNTLANTIKTLYEHSMLYIYKIGEQDKIIINRNIEYVFALKRYNKQEIINEFAA